MFKIDSIEKDCRARQTEPFFLAANLGFEMYQQQQQKNALFKILQEIYIYSYVKYQI